MLLLNVDWFVLEVCVAEAKVFRDKELSFPESKLIN